MAVGAHPYYLQNAINAEDGVQGLVIIIGYNRRERGSEEKRRQRAALASAPEVAARDSQSDCVHFVL